MGVLARFQTIVPNIGHGDYQQTLIPGLFYSTFGQSGGHARLFSTGPKKLNGFTVYQYNHHPGWSSRYTYFLVPGLVALIHEDTAGGTLKTCSPQTGWFLRFAKLKIAKVYKGFTITFQGPQTFR